MNSVRSVLSRLTVGLLVASALVSPIFALKGTVVNVEDSTLNLRENPTANGKILQRLPFGTEVEVLIDAPENGWYKIAFQGSTGYASADYLQLENAKLLTAAAVSAAPQLFEAPAHPIPDAAPSAQPQPTDAKYARVDTSVLNVRAGAGTEFELVKKLRVGTVVEITGKLGDWYCIDGGYISAEFITVVDEAAAKNAGLGQEIANYALGYRGYPYVYGGSSPKGFDCSGFVCYVYKHFGYSLNRTASTQMDNGVSVSRSELQVGDLVFFKKSGSGSKRASHVGIYIGNNQFVHASTARVGVIVSSMNEAYYTSGFVGARRLA